MSEIDSCFWDSRISDSIRLFSVTLRTVQTTASFSKGAIRHSYTPSMGPPDIASSMDSTERSCRHFAAVFSARLTSADDRPISSMFLPWRRSLIPEEPESDPAFTSIIRPSLEMTRTLSGIAERMASLRISEPSSISSILTLSVTSTAMPPNRSVPSDSGPTGKEWKRSRLTAPSPIRTSSSVRTGLRFRITSSSLLASTEACSAGQTSFQSIPSQSSRDPRRSLLKFSLA
ncbi:MAG: hypothetical protein BWX47_00990 [candidate division Hyd24-12 bacterium ADurb.Bin004]|nr:MAG: hypothetical protein BWX47_00990 [candidate division Hyd24-12 bacterium ADurb.Bin004]